MGTDHKHRVCTYAEAEKAIRSHDRIFINDCFCRGPARVRVMEKPAMTTAATA